MSSPKIVGMTKSCGACPNRHGDECPLPDFPAEIIANQQAMIMSMQDPYKWGISLAVITHIAAKFGQNVNASRMTTVNIPYQCGAEEGNLCLDFEYITEILMPGFGIVFRYAEDTFKLYVDSAPPSLSRQSRQHPELWESCKV